MKNYNNFVVSHTLTCICFKTIFLDVIVWFDKFQKGSGVSLLAVSCWTLGKWCGNKGVIQIDMEIHEWIHDYRTLLQCMQPMKPSCRKCIIGHGLKSFIFLSGTFSFFTAVSQTVFSTVCCFFHVSP